MKRSVKPAVKRPKTAKERTITTAQKTQKALNSVLDSIREVYKVNLATSGPTPEVQALGTKIAEAQTCIHDIV